MHEPAIITRSKFIFSWAKARENVYHRVETGFGFTSDWMKKCCEFCKPIGLFRVAFASVLKRVSVRTSQTEMCFAYGYISMQMKLMSRYCTKTCFKTGTR